MANNIYEGKSLFEILNISEKDILDDSCNDYSRIKLSEKVEAFDSVNKDADIRIALSQELQLLTNMGLDKYKENIFERQNNELEKMFENGKNSNYPSKTQFGIIDERPNRLKLYDSSNNKAENSKNIFNLIRDQIIQKDKIQVQEKNIKQHNLKQKWVKITAAAAVVLILVGSGVSVLNNSKSNAPETSVSDYSLEGNETYSDADIKYSFRYKVVYGDTISGIAQKFGVSQSDINKESSKRGSIINEGDTLYIATSDKELAESQEEIYIEQQNEKSK